MAGDASWAKQTNERYWDDIAKRRQSFEEQQRWLFRHRDREVMYHGRRYVIRLRRRNRSFRDARAVWLQWLLHGLRNLFGDVVRWFCVGSRTGRSASWMPATHSYHCAPSM